MIGWLGEQTIFYTIEGEFVTVVTLGYVDCLLKNDLVTWECACHLNASDYYKNTCSIAVDFPDGKINYSSQAVF